MEKNINTPVNVFMVDNIDMEIALIDAPASDTCLYEYLLNRGPFAKPV